MSGLKLKSPTKFILAIILFSNAKEDIQGIIPTR